MVSADVCGRDSLTSSPSLPESNKSPESDPLLLLLLLSDVCFSTKSPLSLSTSLDSDVRLELTTLLAFAVPTAETKSRGALKENDKLSRNPRCIVVPGASFRGCALASIVSGRGASFCEFPSSSSSRSSLSLNVFRLTDFPSGPFNIETCGFLLWEEFIVVVEAVDAELLDVFGAGGSNENTELNSAEARVPFNNLKELVSDPFSPFFDVVRLRVKSAQYGVRRADIPIAFDTSCRRDGIASPAFLSGGGGVAVEDASLLSLAPHVSGRERPERSIDIRCTSFAGVFAPSSFLNSSLVLVLNDPFVVAPLRRLKSEKLVTLDAGE